MLIADVASLSRVVTFWHKTLIQAFLWILCLYIIYALLDEKNGLAQIFSLQICRKIVKAEV